MTRPSIVSVAAVLVAALAVTETQAEGVRLRVLSGIYADSKGVGLKTPEGVAAPDGTRIVVSDTGNGRIIEFAVAGDTITAVSETAFPELPYPTRLAARGKGDLFVLDGKVRRIGIVSGGAFQGWVDTGAAGTVVPRSLRVDGSGNLWVLDVAGSRVLVLGADGKLSRTIGLPSERGTFYSDLAVDGRGNLFVLESLGRRVLVVRAGASAVEPFGGSLAEELDFASALAVDGAGRVYVADQNGGGIVVLGVDGSFQGRESGPGWKDGLLRYPSALAIDPSDRLLVADRGNNRIAMFGLVR